MRASTLAALACPTCRRAYALSATNEAGGEILGGALTCEACGIVTPIVRGFVLFTEARLHAGLADAAALASLEARVFGDTATYEAYRRRKDDRNLWESYAAFHPFNESVRAAEPLLPTFAAHLKPGDFILDTWNRTGWSGEWLAGLFPDNRVISLWEGDSSVLGYRGFDYWLGSGRRAPNHDILFVPPNRPLPFTDGAFGAVYAYDSLHRYDLYPFASECLRVAASDAALLFAHLHLSNSEPDPFFERGCRQDHGRDYRAWLDKVLEGDARRGWVFSEADLFSARAGDMLADNPDTDHYNGDVLIARSDGPTLAVQAAPSPSPDAFLLVNPMLRLDFARSAALVDEAMHDGDVGHHLSRHPIYRKRLPKKPRTLSGADWSILSLAVTGVTVGDVIQGRESNLNALIADEFLIPARVSPAALAMQRFHANQLPVGDPARLLQDLLERLATSEAPAIVMADGSSLSGAELVRTVGALAGLLDQVVETGATEEPLGFLALLTAMVSGRSLMMRPDPVATDRLYEPGGLAEQLGQALEAGKPAPLVRDPGPNPVAEAAASLRHMVRPDQSGVADFSGMNTLLLCLTALFRGEPIKFGGLAEPAP